MPEIETLPYWESYSIAKWVAKATEAYFKRPGVQERFEKWLKERSEMENGREEMQELCKDCVC